MIFTITFIYTKQKTFKKNSIRVSLLYTALIVKLIISFLFSYYYMNISSGGDTINYHNDASAIAQFFWNDPVIFFELFLNSEAWKVPMDAFTYLSYNSNSAVVNTIRLTIPFELISFGGFYSTSIWVSFIAFTGIWKIYELLSNWFNYSNVLILILFIPSVLFWTGGILKDSYILAAVCWLIYAVAQFVGNAEYKLKYILISVLSLIIILAIKPYILLALIPGIVTWVCLEALSNKKYKLIRGPIFLFFTLLIIGVIFRIIQNDLGIYGDYDNLVNVSKTLKKGYLETYQESIIQNSQIRLQQIESNVLNSTFSVIYKPLIGESWNLPSLLASLENTLLLIFTLYVLLRSLFNPKSYMLLKRKSFLIFCILYSILLAAGIGMGVGNYGAIFRFKSAFLIFLLIPILVLYSKMIQRNS